MTDTLTAACAPVAQEGGTLTQVGRVSHFYRHLGVIAVVVQSEESVRKGDIIQVGVTDGHHHRYRALSIERDHHQIEESCGPDHIGIETGHQATVGDPVYVVQEG